MTTPPYTEEQQRALAWLDKLEWQIRVIKANIYLSRYEPRAWDDAGKLIRQMRETAAEGGGDDRHRNPA